MRVTFIQPVADGPERLATGALDQAIGREYPLDIEGQPAAWGVITAAAVLPGGETAELTLDIPDDSPAACLLRETGGGPGPYGISEDGTLYRPVEIRRRDPAEAARLLREAYRENGWPEELAEDVIREMQAPMRQPHPVGSSRNCSAYRPDDR